MESFPPSVTYEPDGGEEKDELRREDPPSSAVYEVGLATKFVLPMQYVRASGVIASVTCFNRAGLTKAGSLGPISFDETPPTFGETALVMSA